MTHFQNLICRHCGKELEGNYEMAKNLFMDIVVQPCNCRQNAISLTKRVYDKHEFCKAKECSALKYGKDKNTYCMEKPPYCHYTAKQLHKWIIDNGFEIVKEECLEKD